jgi:hypothetical protein
MNPAVKILLGFTLILAGFCVEDTNPGINRYLIAVVVLVGVGVYSMNIGIRQIQIGDYPPPASELEGQDLFDSDYYKM